MITGTWTTPEIMVAIEEGYKIVKIHQVFHYSETSQYNPETGTEGIFTEYMRKFFGLKLAASGWPHNVTTEAEKDAFIQECREQIGVAPAKEDIVKNDCIRQLSKLFANSLWGKAS